MPKNGISILLLQSAVALIVVLVIGVIGFRYILNLSWVDSFHNSAFIISGIDNPSELKTDKEKLFASCYAVLGGAVYISITLYLISRIVKEKMV